MREVGLGPMLGNSYVITDGLKEGEEIVTQGAFSIDAAAQLEGKPSMMTSQGGKTSSMPGMVMPGDNVKSTDGSKNEHVGHDTSEKPLKIGVNMDFTMQLNTVFEQYIVLKDAFVQSDVKKVTQAAQMVQQTLANVDMRLLTGDIHTQWMDFTGKLNNQLKQIASTDDIKLQRRAFSGFSNEFYKTIKTFGLMGKTAYYQFCPMAFDGRGAFWLSTAKEIRNPYYGDQMLTCGETKETLNY